MSSIASNAEDLILNADGSGSDIKFKSNGTEVGSISDGGVMTATSFAGSGAALTGVGVAGITSAADATAMTITSDEDIGVGTASPSSRLHVYDGAGANIAIQSSAGSHWRIGDAVGASNGQLVIRDHTNSANRIIIDSIGAVTMPSQPAFLVQLSADMTNVATSTWTTLEASTEIFDQNSDYNTSTYTFTAPVTGKYQFNAMVRLEQVDNDMDYIYVVFSTDNRVYYALQTWRQTQDVSQTHHQLGILADMDANDTCRVRVYISSGHAATDIADTTIWSGHLVC